MKKISLVFALLIMMEFAGGASGATLTWGAMPAGSTITFNNSPSITASFRFGESLVNVVFSHTYDFTSSTTSPVFALLTRLPAEGIHLFNLAFDGHAMEFDPINHRWFGQGDNSLNHSIQLNGFTNLVGSAYVLAAISTAPVGDIPVPAAIWLFGSAVMSLMGFSSRETDSKVLTA